jgi:hypothetical protein
MDMEDVRGQRPGVLDLAQPWLANPFPARQDGA